MTHIVTECCIGCKDAACTDVCPVDSIYDCKDENQPQSHIHPEECIDCGLCIDACPVEAIFTIEDLIEYRQKSIASIGVNYRRFNMESPY